MAVKKDVMVEQKNGKWAVRTTASRSHISFETQAEAIEYGRELARKNESELRVKSIDNKVRIKTSYKKDE